MIHGKRIAVVMPAYNAARTLEKTVRELPAEVDIKILVDEGSERILGAAILGVEGDEVVHVIAANMYAKVSYKVLQQAVHAHPTVSELIPTVLGDLRPLP